MKIFDNNKKSINLIKNPKSQNRTKHINVIYHHMRRLIKDKDLVINWIENSVMLTNSLIKAFLVVVFKKYQKK